MPRRSCSNKS